MNLPYVARAPKLLSKIKNDDTIILDGIKGEVIVDPDKETLQEFEKIKDERSEKQKELVKLIGVTARTEDNHEIGLMCNIEIPDEISVLKKIKSAGIGLFRTEFLFIDRDELPSEDEQFKIYRKIADSIKPYPLIIRTIDVGGDKLSRVLNLESEINPNLGCRGIRISLQHIPIFKTQIRAILRASVAENIKIMFPMISSLEEIVKVKKIISSCKKELTEKNIEYDVDIKIGAMIEIPSAAITSDSIASECDFLSIGTNDLIQYVVAVDRTNDKVADLNNPCHPAVIRLIKEVVEAAHRAGIWVGVCGEAGGDPLLTPLFIAMGIDELSMNVGSVLEIKDLVRHLNRKECQQALNDVLKLSTAVDIKGYLQDLIQ